MRQYYIFILALSLSSIGFGQGSIDFDDLSNWNPSTTSYGNYTYVDGVFSATGIDVLRNTTSNQDGFPGAFGNYSVRLRNNSTTSLTMIISTGGAGTFSMKVRRWDGSPATNFAVETTIDNGATWTPSSSIDATVTTNSDWKTINGTINSSNPNIGVRIISNGSTERLMVDDFSWTAFVGSPSTTVEFTSTSATIAEDGISTDLTFSITNPDGTNATSFDVELTTGDNTDINSYTTQTVTFSAGSSADETVTITLTDDSIFEGDEVLTFSITGVSGGNNATVGTNSTFDLTITDNDPDPSVVIALQDFDGTLPNWNYTTNPEENSASCVSGGDVWNVVNSLGSITVPNSTGNFFGGQDLNGATGCGTTGVGTIDFADISTSGFSNVVVTFDYEIDGFNSGTDELSYIVTYFDPSLQQLPEVFLCDGCNQQNVEGTATINIPDGTSSVRLQIRAKFDGGSDYFGIDNVRISGIYSGLAYSNGNWSPNPPDGTTGSSNAIILDGVVNINSDVSLANITINPGASLNVENGSTLTATTLNLESNSSSFSSLILDGTFVGTANYNRYVNSNLNGNDLIAHPLGGLVGQAWLAFLATGTNATDLLNDGAALPLPTTYAFGPFEKGISDYVNYNSTSIELLTSGIGYRVATNSGSTLQFSGTPESGNISIDIKNEGVAFEEWNLIGNPYPSYLKVQDFLTHTITTGVQNLDLFEPSTASIYGYDGDTSDGWTIYNLANTTPNTVIAPGQGFFVSALSTQVELFDLEFTPAMRSATGGDDFILGRNNNTLTFAKINASTSNDAYNTEIYFDTNATLGLDIGYDTTIFGGTAPSFSIHTHLVEENTGLPVALQTVGLNNISDVTIPLGVNANQGEQLTFTMSESALPANIDVYLDDNVAITSTLLNSEDYILTPNVSLNGVGRFFLRFTDNALSTTENIKGNYEIYLDYITDNIMVSGVFNQATKAVIYDLQGRIIFEKDLENEVLTQQISPEHIKTGIYIVQIKNDSFSMSKKIIIK